MPITVSPPPEDTAAEILRLVTRTYPNGGAHHERAIRLALHQGWIAAIAGVATMKETTCG